MSTEQLVARYNALHQELVEALNAEFRRHSCPKVTAQFDVSKRWIQITHADPPAGQTMLIKPLETLENLTKEPALSAELGEDERVGWLVKRTVFDD